MECAAADRLARGVQVLERRLQIDAHVRRGGEFLAGRREDSDDPLKLRLLGRLEPLLRELSRFPVRSFADRALGLREQVLRGRRVGAHRPGLLDDAREIPRAPLERSLEGFLRFRAALAQRVLRLLEVEVGDVAPGPLDQVRSLGRVRAELRGRPHQVLRVADLLPLRGGEVLSDRVEPLLREFEGALEVVVLHRRARAREEVLDGGDVAVQVLRGQDERLRVGEGGRQVLLEDLLAPFPGLLGQVDGDPEVAAGEGPFRLRERRLRLRQIGPDALREASQVRARVDDRPRAVPVVPLPAFEGLVCLVDRDLVVLRDHRAAGLREGLLGLRDARVDAARLVDHVLGGAEAVLRGLPGPGGLFDPLF